MIIADYLHLRRKGFPVAAAWAKSNMAALGDRTVLAAVVIVALWLSLDSINGYFEQREQAVQKRSKAEVSRLERVIVACLSGGIINVGGVAHECSAKSLRIEL